MSASSLTQGLALLDAAISQERLRSLGHNASRLAEATGIERSRVSRLTQELRELEYLERSESALLAAGPQYFRTAATLNASWLKGSREVLRFLASHLRMTAVIAVADGPRAVLLRYERAIATSDRSLRPGLVAPIWCTGAGRALLWDHSRDGLEELLDDVQFVGVGGPASARSVAEVHSRLERDRANGFIAASQEYVDGVDEFALPIRRNGVVIAALALAGAHRAKGASREVRARLSDAAQQLSAASEGR